VLPETSGAKPLAIFCASPVVSAATSPAPLTLYGWPPASVRSHEPLAGPLNWNAAWVHLMPVPSTLCTGVPLISALPFVDEVPGTGVTPNCRSNAAPFARLMKRRAVPSRLMRSSTR